LGELADACVFEARTGLEAWHIVIKGDVLGGACTHKQIDHRISNKNQKSTFLAVNTRGSSRGLYFKDYRALNQRV
jgi:hypothetical protein